MRVYGEGIKNYADEDRSRDTEKSKKKIYL